MDEWEKAGVPQPSACSLDLTEACNLNCTYCFTNSLHKPRNMTWKMAKNIIDWWMPQANDERGSVQVTAWGGEPFLRWDFWKRLVGYCNEKAKEVGINNIEYGGTTNGLLYTPDKVEWTMKNKSMFMFSHDGIQPAHDRYRKMPNGKGSFKIVDKNLRAAKKIFPGIRSRMTISVENLPYFFETVQYFVEEIGLGHIAFSPVFEDKWNDAAFELLEEEFRKTITYAIKKYKEGTYFTMKHFNDLANKDTYKIFNPCGAGSHFMGWSVDGFCFPCHRFNKHGVSTKERAKSPITIVRPKGDSFEWCNHEWHNSFNFAKDPPERCKEKECELLGLGCNGNCYGVNFDITGDIRKQNDVICKFNELQQKIAYEFRDMAKEAGVRINSSGWGGENQSRKGQNRGFGNEKTCTCYNMCYSEGTEFEIIHKDRTTDMMCECYNTNYSGRQGPTRPLKDRFELVRTTMPLVKRIFETRFQEKTDEEKELEGTLLSKFFDHIDR